MGTPSLKLGEPRCAFFQSMWCSPSRNKHKEGQRLPEEAC